MFMGIEQKNLKLLSCHYLLKKVSKQKFVAKIQDSYWLFVLGERDKHKDGEQLIEPKSWGCNKVGMIKYFLIRISFLVKTCNEQP